LQHSIKEAELTDWQAIDWAAILSATPAQDADASNEGVSWMSAKANAIGFDHAFGNTLIDYGLDHEDPGLLCLYPSCFCATADTLRLGLLWMSLTTTLLG